MCVCVCVGDTCGVNLAEFNNFRPRAHTDETPPGGARHAGGGVLAQTPAVVDMLPWDGSLSWLAPPQPLLSMDLASGVPISP